MSTLKKAWITPWERGLVSLSLESLETDPEYRRLDVENRLFPSPKDPSLRRFTTILRILTVEDLQMIRDAIDAYLEA